MIIRKAEETDIPIILELLKQVLQIHADIRPDIFIPGTTKYTADELMELLKNDEKPIYVAVDEDNVCVGYAFCQLQEQPFSNNMVPFKSLFIDDLCVSQETRGRHIGECLFEYVKNEAKQLGCYEVTLNVWAGNTSAERFYEKMGMRTKERQMEYILCCKCQKVFYGSKKNMKSGRNLGDMEIFFLRYKMCCSNLCRKVSLRTLASVRKILLHLQIPWQIWISQRSLTG